MGRGQGELELGSVPSELGRRKEPGPRGSCEDVEGSWGAGAGLEKPSGPRCIPGPMLTQPAVSRGYSLVAVASLVEHRLCCPAPSGILVPTPRIEPVSPALAGRCFTTGPPGESQV